MVERYQANRESICAQRKERYNADPARYRQASKAHYQKLDADAKRVCIERAARRDKAYPDQARARVVMRRTRKIRATPPWLTAADLAEIQRHYFLADLLTKTTGLKWHVDHQIPLRGRGVCGLHVPWNLQVLTAKENIKKGNRY